LPFHLHPEYPPGGLPRTELVAKYGGDHFQQVRSMAEEAGLVMNPHPEVIPNTRDALELGEWARTFGGDVHLRMHDRLMDAYWVEGQDLTQWDILAACVVDVGLDPLVAHDAVMSREFAPVVDGWTQWARRNGVNGVPAFILDRRLLISGAVPHEYLERAVSEALSLRESTE
jgi:predicted DsbA family dithiol-disulfide isomerase